MILPLLKTITTKEIQSSTQTTTILRSNSISTKLMSGYLFNIGKNYLRLILNQPLEYIISSK